MERFRYRKIHELSHRQLVREITQSKYEEHILVVLEPHQSLTKTHKEYKLEPIPYALKAFQKQHKLLDITMWMRSDSYFGIQEADCIFLFCDHMLLSNEMNLEEVHQKYAAKDDSIVYINYTLQDAQG